MLSAREEEIIKETWAKISTDLKKSGANVFLQFFTDYPMHQKTFKPFANIPFNELAGNKRFQAHAFTVISTINGMIENLDDPEFLEEMLLKTGANHSRRHKVAPQAFNEFKESFKRFLQSSLENSWNEEASKAWERVANLIITKIIDGMESESD